MKLLHILAVILLHSTLHAQNNCHCCDKAHNHFDFWIGEWSVVDSVGNRLGENSISRIEGNRIISEHWTGSKGYTGSSYNYFDRSDSTWNQLWIDNRGNILKLKGRFEGGSMVLRSELTEGQKVDWYYNQISWTKTWMEQYPRYGKFLTRTINT
jgi:hypothetical protein